jgi:pimeloyl-ACP methyl ester carboxylesterase
MHESLPATTATAPDEFDVKLNGAVLRVRRLTLDPERPTIIFLHDSLGCIKLWRDFPDRLCAATNCNGLIYDRQGYGQSSPFTEPRRTDYLEKEADVVAALLSELGLAKAVLFGHSDGGSIALLAAARSPAKVSTVITEGAHVFVEEITLDGIRAAKAQAPGLLRRLKKYHGQNTEAAFDAWTEIWLLPEFRDFNMERFLPAIHCPVMVIQGAEDEYGSEKQVNAIVDQVSGTSLKFMVPSVGHTPHRDAVASVLDATASFISRM